MIALAAPPVLDWTTLVAETRALVMPEVVLTLFGCLALILDVLLARKDHRLIAYTSLGGVALAAASTVSIWAVNRDALPRLGFFNMIVVDEFALVFKGVVLLALGLSIALSIRYLDIESEQRGEFYALMLFAGVGMTFVASGYDLLTLYVSLELMAISVYILVGYLKRSRASNEAALKYFLLGAFSSGVLLYGISLLYGLTGSTNLREIRDALPALAVAGPNGDARYLLLATIVLLAAGLCFKVAAVPFHMWAPDAYEGAPTPVTAFMSVGVKAASFALFARVFLDALPALRSSVGGPDGPAGWAVLLGIVAAITMTWGNLGALTQRNSKRLLAYSSISHAGFLLLGLVAGNETGYAGLVIYVIVYVAMNLGAFGVVIAMRRQGIEGDRVEDFAGLAARSPGLAVLMTIFLLSLGGIPPTAGFVGKFYLFYGLVRAGEPWLVALAVVAVLNTAVAAYYYFIFVKAMFMGEPDETAPAYETSGGVWTALGVAAIVTILAGVFPQPVIELSRRAVERLRPAPTSTVELPPPPARRTE